MPLHDERPIAARLGLVQRSYQAIAAAVLQRHDHLLRRAAG
jgi:hypothetical protein